jgi:LuxR family maltose regulon positive regulatory protein
MDAAESARLELTQLNAISHLALVEAEGGGLHEAAAHAQSALHMAERRGWRAVLQIVPAYLAMALTNLEWDVLGEAESAFRKGLATQRADPEPVQYFALRVVEARILLARGEADAARLVIKQLEWPTDAGATPLVLARWLAVAEAEIELAAGNPDEVFRIVGPAGAESLGARMQICVARAHLMLGDLRTAEMVLAPLHTSAPDAGSAAEAWLVTALVEDSLRRNSRSADAFARAVALAEPQGMRRLFVGIGHSRTSALLERYQWLATEKSAFVAALADSTSDRSAAVPALTTEELTDRELDVLRYLPTMLRNRDIAAQMYVSVNTVKAHLRGLYRKLGVTQRRQAVDRARELGLL